MRRALLLINPRSRRGGEDIEPILDVLRQGGIELIAPDAGDGAETERALAELGPTSDLVIVGGGDGTINRELGAVLKLGKPLGILPLGTANDLARTLELPVRPEESAGVILRGKTRKIDVGQVNDKLFLNVASIGMSGEVARELDSDLKARWGIFGYALSLWRVVVRRRAISVDIRCDGKRLKTRAIQISIGNGRFYGGGMTIAADADIDDGTLDLVLMAPQPLWKLVRRLLIFRWGHHDLNDTVRHLRGREIALQTRTSLPINTDGEITTETPALFRLIPKTLEVFVP